MTPTCRFCRAPGTFRFEATDMNRRITDARFAYYTCSGCRTVFLPEIPADLGRYYPSEYYSLPTTRAQLAALAANERFKLDIVRQAVGRGRLLEIGPGTGAFALLAQDAGFDVDVVEMDAGACAFMREVVGINAMNRSDVSATLRTLDCYDVIALWHVIEHLPDPRETVRAAAARLAPGGALVIAAPRPESLQFRLFGSRWTHLDAPRHLQLIPIDAIAAEAGRAGLRLAGVTTTDLGGIGWNQFGWKHSLGNLSTQPERRDALEKLGLTVDRALARVERRGSRGTAYTITLQKD